MIPFRLTRPVALVNARVVAGQSIAESVRFTSRVLSVDRPPKRGDVVVDAGGAFVLPGLVNAHDHLELNHYGLLKSRERYENASAWVDDMRPRLQSDPGIRANRAHALGSRLFIGGVKNLLAGVTTVAHHNPKYRELSRSVPVHVVRRYGWAHSFQLQAQPVGARGEIGGDVQTRFAATPDSAPFIVHVAEGVDHAAAEEVDRLDALGCLRSNTVVVHGVGMTRDQWLRLVERRAGLVWCPASNRFLFGRTVPVDDWLAGATGARARMCLGNDSRITGARDLLDELRVARAASRLPAQDLLEMVTTRPADLLRLPDAGRIREGAPADLLMIPATAPHPAEALLRTARADVALVTVAGRPLVGSATLAPLFRGRGSRPVGIVVDDVAKIADGRLARAIAASSIREPGVACRS